MRLHHVSEPPRRPAGVSRSSEAYRSRLSGSERLDLCNSQRYADTERATAIAPAMRNVVAVVPGSGRGASVVVPVTSRSMRRQAHRG